jgi:hypothetical protein
MSAGKKSFVCSICHCKHQMARGQQCKQLKHNLPIFTTFVRAHDASGETSFARNTDESLESVLAIRRLMAFMHSHTEEYRSWSLENPTSEIGPESSVIVATAGFARAEPMCRPATEGSSSSTATAGSFLPEPVRGSLGEFEVSPSIAEPAAATAGTGGGGEKGPAPPCLSFEFLSKAPKISTLVLKK